jgi:hypothetical protein
MKGLRTFFISLTILPVTAFAEQASFWGEKRLIILLGLAIFGSAITLIVQRKSIVAFFTEFRQAVIKTESEKYLELIEHYKNYLLCYGYDFDNGKGRTDFTIGDIKYETSKKCNIRLYEFFLEKYDEAVNSLVDEEYLEPQHNGLFRFGYLVTAKGRNRYTSHVAKVVQSSIDALEKEFKTP